MHTQQDHKVRVISLDNLHAMCKRISGMCHQYRVDKVSRSRVTVSYTNPDEYGNDQPVFAVFPCYPSNWPEDGADNPRVILDPLRLSGPGADWDMFHGLESCPTLWRNANVWESHADVLARQGRKLDTPCTSCTQCDVPKGAI